ncbi:MAG: sialate O-acetylesterase [Candidatus Omnitrophica bacterium]|nr:sialate O-acetylesterase [Candidatus Omnitrophota bacterium]
MEVEVGLFDNMVLQVNDKKITDSEFSGRCFTHGRVLLTVKDNNGRIVKGFRNVCAGDAEKGFFKGKIKGLKAGGPYSIEICIQKKDGKISEKKIVKNILAGYVWVAAGQSNMQGCGLLKDAAKPHPMVRAFYMNDKWDIAKDPIHNLWECVDDVHVDLGVVREKRVKPIIGTGPAVAFAQKMYHLTGIPQGIIACAHGGTSMSQWDPSLKKLGGKSLYGATLRRIKKNGGKIAGIIWYQGESDSTQDACVLYTERMKKLVSSFRKDLKKPDLPFVAVQIGRFINTGFRREYWNSIQNQQYKLLKKIKNFSLVPSVHLSLDDTIHISGRDQNRLGKDLAYAMSVLIGFNRQGKPPIELDEKSIKMEVNPPNNYVDIILKFKNVAKSFFVPDGIRPSGFVIGDPEPGPFIYDIKISKDTVILRTNLSLSGIEGKSLYHGYGLDPYCNIKDVDGRVIFVFGPVRLGKYRALTGMLTEWDIMFPFEIPQGIDAKLNGLDISHSHGINWNRMKFQTRFCDLHEKLAEYKGKDFVIWFSRSMKLPEPMKLAACIGYDGPVKMWIDEKEIFHDPEGTNPAWEDKAIVKFNAEPGEHKIVIALGSNKAMAWGIYFRIERLDVSRKLVKSGAIFPMPEFI